MTHRAPWTDREKEIVRKLVAEGLRQDAIGERLGRTKRAIRWHVGRERNRPSRQQGK